MSALVAPKVVVANTLPLAIDVYEYDPLASPPLLRFVVTVPIGTSEAVAVATSSIRVMVHAFSAIVADLRVDSADAGVLKVGTRSLVDPFAIGRPPAPSADLLLPPDTVSVLVGVGTMSGTSGTVLLATREQFWHKSPQSFSLPPRSKEQKILRRTTGRMQTSSTSEEATKEIGSSVSAGWGPFSASVSASLSTTSRRTDTVTVRESSTATVVQEFANDSDDAVLVYLWQLVDRVRVILGSATKVAVDSLVGPAIPVAHRITPT